MIDKVAWVELERGRILSTRSRGRVRYYLPGGKRERGETDLDTLVREIKEELSVDLQPDSATFLGEFSAQADAAPAGVQVRMRCYECRYLGQLRPAAEIAEMAWLGYLGRAFSSPVDQLVFDRLRAAGRL